MTTVTVNRTAGSTAGRTAADNVLAELIGPASGVGLRLTQAALVVAGIAFLAVFSKITIPMWPVPVTMGTFAVLTLGAAYGPALGLTTILGYMALGALGVDVFAGSSAGTTGLAYMMGGTGGYLLGYVIAVGVIGAAARAGMDRTMAGMAAVLLLANALIYVPGLIWLAVLYGMDQPILAWGLWPFLAGDALKLALAAVLIPSAWKLVGRARG